MEVCSMETPERSIRVADEAWLALAMLQYEHPDRESFSAKEILDQVKVEHANPELRPGVQVHIYLHNVANVEPNSAKYRMFYKLANDSYRLYRAADVAHAARKGRQRLPSLMSHSRAICSVCVLAIPAILSSDAGANHESTSLRSSSRFRRWVLSSLVKWITSQTQSRSMVVSLQSS